ncbi:MAG: aminotransferase class I/II-fold pyridoxal phosphate-dependent enzyme [Planctomycetes bacterium]|nr:aminotransferase class I/II-fold pyridoxal phosphate-dependent enzyme [Planctomycetota bacterium]
MSQSPATAAPTALNPLAAQANAALAKDCPVVLDLLSQLGKRMYFPAKGILAQGAEARAKGKRYNATIGIATDANGPMHLACVHQSFAAGMDPKDLYVYAPSDGKPELRKAWAEKQRAQTPSLAGHPTSQPIVTNALTHGLSLIGDLFLDPGDEVLVTDLMWENYPLCWETRLGARVVTFPLFDKRLSGFNQDGFMQALASRRGRKLVVVLNFPNNPSGYTVSKAEAGAIVNALIAAADAGTKLVVACDDAYYGMFFDAQCETESLFGRLARAHANLLAIKVDGATKEEFVWGLRVGFLTYGVVNATPAAYTALEQKTAGLIRATISNVSHAGQTVVLKALQHPDFAKQQAEKVEILRRRAAVTAIECRKPEYADCWDVYPFNSGYFMCVRLKDADADTVRVKLLDEHGLGTIALGATDLRVAFSCLLEEQIPDVFARLAQGVRSVRGR